MRRREGAARAPWTLRVLLLLVAFGAVLMHHVAGGHQHAPDPAPAVVEHAEHAPAPWSTVAALHVHHDAPGHDPAGSLHDCLAVLAAATAVLAIAAAVALVGWWRPGGLRRDGPQRSVRRGEVPAPATPVPLRLAQLQVLRL